MNDGIKAYVSWLVFAMITAWVVFTFVAIFAKYLRWLDKVLS